MRTTALAIALALVACSGEPEVYSTPDAHVHVIDAGTLPDVAPQPDARPPEIGCHMGNLPNARTLTLTDGDPVPADLIDELQDAIVGAKTGPHTRRFMPDRWLVAGGGAATVVANTSTAPASILVEPVWRFTASDYRTALDYEVGEVVSGFAVDAIGDAAVDWDAELLFSSSMSTQVGTVSVVATLGSITNDPAVWTRRVFAVTPVTLVDGGRLVFHMVTSGGVLCLGDFSLLVSRP